LTTLLVDTSVLVKWFHREGEAEIEEAHAIHDANLIGEIEARVIDLALYEVGNVALKVLHLNASDVADQLDYLVGSCGLPLVMKPEWLRKAAFLGAKHQLSFYDAAWAGAAEAMGVSLVSADSQLLAAGLAESPTQIVERLRLRYRPAGDHP
jgi:predicted nucleic acid-binding protein